jgi:hypothetical protein
VRKASVYMKLRTMLVIPPVPHLLFLHRVIKSANPEHHGKCSLFGSSDDR